MKLNKTVIAMVHVAALPGTPGNSMPVKEIVKQAVAEAELLLKYNVDALLIENMHDRPYLNRKVGPEIVASMAVVAAEIKKIAPVPVGVQLLAGANKAALGVAMASGLDFIRAEGFVFGHLADEGWMDSDAGKLLRFRRNMGCEHISVYTDIKKKHAAHVVSGDVSIAETARAAAFFLSDGIVITGETTGRPADAVELHLVKNAVTLPVIIGSGIDGANISFYWPLADAFIVGSSIKTDGKWYNPVNEQNLELFMRQVEVLKTKM